jgi:hypothetical protein
LVNDGGFGFIACAFEGVREMMGCGGEFVVVYSAGVDRTDNEDFEAPIRSRLLRYIRLKVVWFEVRFVSEVFRTKNAMIGFMAVVWRRSLI